jgi:hypothetical protein
MIWQKLLNCALAYIDNTPIDSFQWRFGGGTVLMIRYHHRMSRDIDIFFSDPQLLPYVSPRVNDILDQSIGDYSEQSRVIKLILEEGKIDFIVASPVTDQPYEVLDFEGRSICVDSSTEIIAKKIFYRKEEFKARDIFDLATVLLHEEQDALVKFCASHPEETRIVLDRTQAMIRDGTLAIGLDALDILPDGKHIRDTCSELVPSFLVRVVKSQKHLD